MFEARNYIGGEWVATAVQEAVINPADESKVGVYHPAGAEETRRAVESAESAGGTYGSWTLDQRADRIRAFARELEGAKEEILSLLILETGKTKENAGYDFKMLVDCLDFYLEEVRRRFGRVIPDPGGQWFNFLSHRPVGVVGAYLTWNFPLLNLGYKLGPILASGCTAVIKPAQQTPLATTRVFEIFHRIGFPMGTLNLIHGARPEMYQALSGSRIPRLLTMIGSTPGGLRMVQDSLTSIKRYSLELGGNAPVLVFGDCDLDRAVSETCSLKFSNAGQICVAPNRVYVHRSIYEAFIDKCVAHAKKLVPLGDGKDEIQPVHSLDSLQRILGYLEHSVRGGAKVAWGGKRMDRKGFFLEPTILRDVDQDQTFCQNEIFGPLLPISSFRDEGEVIASANRSDAGLAAYLFTKDLDRAHRVSDKLISGNVCVNGVHYSIDLPHGGFKQSGYGKDVSSLALDDYFDIKRTSIRIEKGDRSS